MGIEHDTLAQKVSAVLLNGLRTSSAGNWATARLSSRCILWQGIADWPRPDIAFEDTVTGATLALEFKPPNQTKREYVTGVGQMLTYLRDFEFAGLVVPEKADDGFPIADYIERLVTTDLADQPITLLSYDRDVSALTVRRTLIPRTSPAPQPRPRRRGTFWAYWRDLSNHDVLALLDVIYSNPAKDFPNNFRKYWAGTVLKGKALDWEGNRRVRSKGGQEVPERRNAFYSLRHCGLVSSDGKMTATGLELLQVERVYGADSDAFRLALARRVLLDGGHLELILWVEAQTRAVKPAQKKMAADYRAAIDKELARIGVIPPRPTQSSKPFFRDEGKLWNKLGLLHRNGRGYFYAGEGYRFDWRAIISAVRDGARAT